MYWIVYMGDVQNTSWRSGWGGHSVLGLCKYLHISRGESWWEGTLVVHLLIRLEHIREWPHEAQVEIELMADYYNGPRFVKESYVLQENDTAGWRAVVPQRRIPFSPKLSSQNRRIPSCQIPLLFASLFGHLQCLWSSDWNHIGEWGDETCRCGCRECRFSLGS